MSSTWRTKNKYFFGFLIYVTCCVCGEVLYKTREQNLGYFPNKNILVPAIAIPVHYDCNSKS